MIGDTRIRDVQAWEALDSRGRPTVGCRVTLNNGGCGRVIVPSGKSTAGREAVELRDGESRYLGDGVRKAVSIVRDELGTLVRGRDATDRAGIDDLLTDCDPDPLLGNVGGNSVLAVSLAVWLAGADGTGRQLWQSVTGTGQPLLPMPMVNIISGGAHARGAIDLQDILLMPVGASAFSEAIEWAARVRTAAAELLATHGGLPSLVADEGGLAARFDSNEAAMRMLTDAIHHSELEPGRDACLAVDIAANQLWDDRSYRLETERQELTSAEFVDRLTEWAARYPILSWEDVLHEDDWTGWAEATGRLGHSSQLIGDDLFATDEWRLDRGVRHGVANAVLVKPNQAGTVSRAERVIARARSAGYSTVLSARSGDTEDWWLADLAVGWGTGQIKVGSTTRSERTAKWNRLLELEATAGPDLEFAGAIPLQRWTG